MTATRSVLRGLSFDATDDRDVLKLIQIADRGLSFSQFVVITKQSPFTLREWSQYLHLSERTLQRYRKEKRSFDTIHTERIFTITMFYRMGVEVFESEDSFDTWLDIPNPALGGHRPKDLLRSSFGIQLLRDELNRIEHGVLA